MIEAATTTTLLQSFRGQISAWPQLLDMGAGVLWCSSSWYLIPREGSCPCWVDGGVLIVYILLVLRVSLNLLHCLVGGFSNLIHRMYAL
jgi:hypothetical protein